MDGARRAGTQAKAIEVRLLGPLEAGRGDRPVALGGPKPRALLAVLALELGRVVSSDHLVEALWPGDAPETASHAVQVYVSQLRKALGPVIVTRPPGYALELDPDAVDVHRFVRLAGEGRTALQAEAPELAETSLREALALWRGPALADFAYEPFAQAEIARLDELRTVVVEERIEADLALGRHAELVSELEALVQAQPHRERPRAQFMLALYRSGRQADALAAYRAARDVLVDELGIEPGPELKELEGAILRQDASLVLDEATPARPALQFRRLASILFVDVVESMSLGEVLDPEAIGTVQRRFFETVSAAITRHGGTVEKYAGDAVMAAFGVPVSHEDDALRAARAAFDIRTGVAALNERLEHDYGIRLELRTGIAAGEVVATAEGGQRFVAGDPVGIAARLQHSAEPGEIVVGEIVARLIDHAATLVPRGDIRIPGRREPFLTFALEALVPAAPAFERRLDAPLVGRKRELRAVRTAIAQAIEEGSPRLVVVSGPPGIGKSRLAAEVARRARGVTRLSGRCLPYGEGITYWPLREACSAAAPGPGRDSVLAALDADPPPPAPEIALLFRRCCEAAAHEKPLVVVFDDFHWAEPTFRELVEHLVDRGEGPIVVVCVAREELFEARPDFVEARANATLVELDTLAPEEADRLLEELGGEVLESDQRARIVVAAEGHPFFLEQLLALGLEGGLAAHALPETVQALLAARLDRLGPGERAVLERGAVIGKEFQADDVAALLEPEAAPTVAAHMQTLAARGFVRPVDGDAFAFRHVLVQEAVYRAAPKRLRAELHERFADRLDAEHSDLADLDEFVGYHLEQAYRFRSELGESDRRAEGLARDAGRRLGSGGMRAFRRSDHSAAKSLLERANSLVVPDESLSRELRCNVAIIEYWAGEPDKAVSMLHRVIADASAAADEHVEAWARAELEYIRVRREHRTADSLLAAAEAAVPILERAGNFRALGRVLLMVGWAQGGHRSNHTAWLEAAERAHTYFRQAGWPGASPLAEIACALYWGPTPVNDGIRRLEALLREEQLDLVGSAHLTTFLGGLVAQAGRLEEGASLVRSARDVLMELGLQGSVLSYCDTVLGEVELLAGDGEAAEATLRSLCHELEQRNDFSQLASRASDLAEALVMQGRLDEALEWTLVAEGHAASDDVNARMMWPPIRARILARRGEPELAIELASQGARLSDTTDDLNRRAEAHRDLGEVCLLGGRSRDAASAFARAIDLFEQKGNAIGARSVRSLDDDLALV
jgi:DNA-binding SARP family transcriptional activator